MTYHFDDCTLDLARRELRRGGVPVEVEPQVLDLIAYLVRERERVVSKDDLLAQVWRGRIVSDSTLTSRITAARKAIGDDGHAQRLIRTIARKGVRFVGEVREAFEEGAASESASPAQSMPSIAVLPFDNMSGDEEAGFLADGIAEDIITELARYPGFFVIARNSSFSFRGRAADVRSIGRELRVRYLLEGSLRVVGTRVRVTGQLIDAEADRHLWAQRYDRAYDDLFGVQDEIANAVAGSLAPAIAQAEQERAARRPPASLDAWGACQRGTWHLAKGSVGDNVQAEHFFRRAIELDPLFAPAYVGLSAVLSRSKGTQAAEESAARRAVQLDGANAEARARLALALLARGEHASAEAEARQSIALCPNLAAGHGALGVVLAYSGRAAEGVRSLEVCLRLDPAGPSLVNRLNQLALAYYLDGDYPAAAEAARKAIAAFPNFPSPHRWLAAALGQLGQREEAARSLGRAIEIAPAEFDFQVRGRPAWFRPEDHLRMLEGLHRAGWPGPAGLAADQ